MNDRIEIAKRFAEAINSDEIFEIILYGSVARGDDTEDSDIDILIISNNFHDIEDFVADEVLKVLLEDYEYISAQIMSNDHFEKTKNFSFLKNVLKEGVVIG